MSIKFQIPKKVFMEKSNNFHGIFILQPLENGYGVTIGNSLRRVLLSSIQGYAIVSIKIHKIEHEFSIIKGVKEDTIDIILNLKKIRFKKIKNIENTKEETISICINKKSKFKAGDIEKFTPNFKILNPELIICNIDENFKFNIDINIKKGRGYIPAEQNKNENKNINNNIGIIPIDSIFTPIKNVKFTVKNIKINQKKYEKLIIEIHTDGSIYPKNALKESVNILIKHFILFSNKNIILESNNNIKKEIIDEEILKIRKLLKIPLSDLDLSVRAFNCLKAANVKNLSDLVKLEVNDMMKFRNFGKKSLTELENLVKEKKLSFGIDLSKYKIE